MQQHVLRAETRRPLPQPAYPAQSAARIASSSTVKGLSGFSNVQCTSSMMPLGLENGARACVRASSASSQYSRDVYPMLVRVSWVFSRSSLCTIMSTSVIPRKAIFWRHMLRQVGPLQDDHRYARCVQSAQDASQFMVVEGVAVCLRQIELPQLRQHLCRRSTGGLQLVVHEWSNSLLQGCLYQRIPTLRGDLIQIIRFTSPEDVAQ